jgi:hypothetical protein
MVNKILFSFITLVSVQGLAADCPNLSGTYKIVDAVKSCNIDGFHSFADKGFGLRTVIPDPANKYGSSLEIPIENGVQLTITQNNCDSFELSWELPIIAPTDYPEAFAGKMTIDMNQKIDGNKLEWDSSWLGSKGISYSYKFIVPPFAWMTRNWDVQLNKSNDQLTIDYSQFMWSIIADSGGGSKSTKCVFERVTENK